MSILNALKARAARAAGRSDAPAIRRRWLAALLSLPLLWWFIPYFLRTRTLDGRSLPYQADGSYDWHFLASMVLEDALLLLVIPIIAQLGQRFPIWSHGRFRWRHLGGHALFAAAYGIIRPLWDWPIRVFLREANLAEPAIPWTIALPAPQEAPAHYVLILAATHIWFALWRIKDRERQLTQARLSALKAQLQPHFLFNTLHSISTLMEDDVPAARRMIAGLADLLRTSLAEPAGELVSLEEELEMVRAYLGIEGIRFADRLEVTYDFDDGALRARVPHLILQPLVENAVRHGISQLSSGAEITVGARRDGDAVVISVEDNGPGPSSAEALGSGTPHFDPVSGSPRQVGGLGLRNVRERIEAFYGGEAQLELDERPGGGCLCRLTLPFGTQPGRTLA
ncbi:MAG: histidine kinase [Acidobacteriota bacterium]